MEKIPFYDILLWGEMVGLVFWTNIFLSKITVKYDFTIRQDFCDDFAIPRWNPWSEAPWLSEL